MRIESWPFGRFGWLTHSSYAVDYETVVGSVDALPSAGVAHFEWLGQALSLELMGDDLWAVFADASSPHPRQLYAQRVSDTVVILDFNRAHFLPCAFTAFATCPVPPRQNRLPIAAAAGEFM